LPRAQLLTPLPGIPAQHGRRQPELPGVPPVPGQQLRRYLQRLSVMHAFAHRNSSSPITVSDRPHRRCPNANFVVASCLCQRGSGMRRPPGSLVQATPPAACPAAVAREPREPGPADHGGPAFSIMSKKRRNSGRNKPAGARGHVRALCSASARGYELCECCASALHRCRRRPPAACRPSRLAPAAPGSPGALRRRPLAKPSALTLHPTQLCRSSACSASPAAR